MVSSSASALLRGKEERLCGVWKGRRRVCEVWKGRMIVKEIENMFDYVRWYDIILAS